MTTYTESELLTMYDDMLDDCYGIVYVAGIMYDTSSLLKEVDPIAYDCGFHDYIDSLEKDG